MNTEINCIKEMCAVMEKTSIIALNKITNQLAFNSKKQAIKNKLLAPYINQDITLEKQLMNKADTNKHFQYDLLKKELDKINSATLTPKETAQLLNVDVRTIRKHLKSGTLKGMRVSERCWRIAKDDILTYFKTTTA